MARCCCSVRFWSVTLVCIFGCCSVGCSWGLFGFGGGVAPTTFLVAYGGDGVKMWRWLGVWCCVWGGGVWQS
jgi:hypothetical protein